ncbi:uncharacterized protein LOC122563108 [Chiloscyllium plagiosum]|uniref:uncharacterized protein LOC122563108 n=1 Tax=Chiloscyllium plagiosum TaxID=36176 RepID=UPI001CB82B15|nr:uncharacterized protein LOC122563108 [Chiloscyllium plagiosum]
MELVYRRCLQSDREGHSKSLPLAPDQRQQEKQLAHCKAGSDENEKERGLDVCEKSVQSTMPSNQKERKDNCVANDPVKTAKGKVHQRENKVHLIHERKHPRPPEKTIKCGNDSSHKSQESATVKPQNAKQDAVPRGSSTSLSKKGEKSEIHLKKISVQAVEKNAPGTSSMAQIPVRITPRVDGVGRSSGSFLVPRHDPLKNPPIMKSKPTESRSSEPPVKRNKTVQAVKPDAPKKPAQEMSTDVTPETAEKPGPGFCGIDFFAKPTCTIPGKAIQGSTGVDKQSQDRWGVKAAHQAASSDDELSDDDIFREVPQRYTDKTIKTKEKTNNKFKGDQLSLNAATPKDIQRHQKKHSCKNVVPTKEGSQHPTRDLKSHSTSATGCKVSKAGKEVSRSDTTTEKGRPKNETHKDPRSALILAKRDKLMKAYRLDCETFAMVAKQLVNQDPTIEKQVQLALRKSLQLVGERCLEELKRSIAKYDAANSVKNPK